MEKEVKSGVKTSEFWMTVITAIAAVLAAVADVIPSGYAGIMLALSNGFYAFSRGMVKKK